MELEIDIQTMSFHTRCNETSVAIPGAAPIRNFVLFFCYSQLRRISANRKPLDINMISTKMRERSQKRIERACHSRTSVAIAFTPPHA